MPRPAPDEHAPPYEPYVRLVPEDDILAAMAAQLDEVQSLLGSVGEDESLVRHAPYTWSTREVVGHINDGERVFAYRALRFGRGDATPLAGFEENAYAEAAGSNRTPLADHAAEFASLRRASLHLFRALDGPAWSLGGEASGHFVTVRDLAYILVGHVRHHAGILRQRLGRD